MKLRLIPILIALAGSSAILFGGWFIYRSVAMESPMKNLLNGTPGVEQSEASFDNQKAVFDLKLNDKANLREIVHKINIDGSSIIGDRKLSLNITSNSSEQLDVWWSQALFDVAQAMENKQYAQIPVVLQQKALATTGLKVQTEMDDQNVYVRLTDGKHTKFEILPRNPEKLGVWSVD